MLHCRPMIQISYPLSKALSCFQQHSCSCITPRVLKYTHITKVPIGISITHNYNNFLLSDWSRARDSQSIQGYQSQVEQTWSKPSSGWVKINVDASVFSGNAIGFGSVIRDENGKFLRARSGRVAGTSTPREAEALSLKEALSWVKELGIDHCIFESDSKSLVEACKRDYGESYFHTIVSDCRELCKHYDNVLIEFVRRSANSVTHVLATHSTSDLREWVDTHHGIIHHVLCSDVF